MMHIASYIQNDTTAESAALFIYLFIVTKTEHYSIEALL